MHLLCSLLEVLGDKKKVSKKSIYLKSSSSCCYMIRSSMTSKEMSLHSAAVPSNQREKNPKTKRAEIPQKHISILLT